MKSREAKRIEAVEAASAPQRIISEELNIVELSETCDHYLKHLSTESLGRKLATLMPDLKLADGKGSKRKTQSQTPPDLQGWISRWYFVVRLMAGLNSTANDFIFAAQGRLDLTEVILQFKGMLLASNPNVRWIDAVDLGKYAAFLVKARYNITSNWCELESLKLACEYISGKYGQGHKLLHKTFSEKIEELHKRTLEWAQEYEHALKELLAARAPSGTRRLPDLSEIDFKLSRSELLAKVTKLLGS